MMWEPPIGWSLNPLGIRTWEPESNRNTLGSLKMYAQRCFHRAKALVCNTVPVMAGSISAGNMLMATARIHQP
jgi:hypothetical protein